MQLLIEAQLARPAPLLLAAPPLHLLLSPGLCFLSENPTVSASLCTRGWTQAQTLASAS